MPEDRNELLSQHSRFSLGIQKALCRAFGFLARLLTHQQLTFVLDDVRDPATLAAAWQQVVDRTPVLRGHIVCFPLWG